MTSTSVLPMKVYGPEPSYFTGKLEAVLRYKEIPYTRISQAPDAMLAKQTGIGQVPAVELADGRWLTDSTPIIEWLDQEFAAHPVIPGDPLLAFLSALLEDYADEWLWRPAMHYRWDYEQDAYHLSRVLGDELELPFPLPGPFKRRLIRFRQKKLFSRTDGVTAATWDHVESIYLSSLSQLGAIFEKRPYLLGERPSLADFGFFGSMFRHFGMDPTPSRIMRDTAPGVYEWVARTWNARASRMSGDLITSLPEDWTPILEAVGSAYLPYLAANAEALQNKAPSFDVSIEGVTYRKIRTAAYRVWCLEQLRRKFHALADDVQLRAREVLESSGCWEPLWRVEDIASGIDPNQEAPFARGASMTGL